MSGRELLHCPEFDCSHGFEQGEELTSHLEWDHNYSKAVARRKARDVATEKEQ